MNVQSGIPLRAEPNAVRAAERRSFVRAATAIFLGGQKEHGRTDRILRSMDELIISALSRELQDASAGAAEVVIGQALAIATEQSMDAALFSDAPADDTRPAGLLYGVTPIDASSAPTAAEGVAQTLGLLAEKIGAAGINTDDMVIITTPKLATKIRVLASPKFANVVLNSSSVADGNVIGIVPRGLITGYSDGVKIELSSHATLHMEDTAPADIGTPQPTQAQTTNQNSANFAKDSLPVFLPSWSMPAYMAIQKPPQTQPPR